MDPLAVVFIPGGLIAAALLFGTPVALIAHLIWRLRAHRRLARRCCGHCGREFLKADQFLVAGIRICESCALAFRRRLRLALPLIAITAALFAVTSASAFVVSLQSGGSELAWWLEDGRWIPLLLPSVGIAIVTALVVKSAKLANRIARPNLTSPLAPAGSIASPAPTMADEDVG